MGRRISFAGLLPGFEQKGFMAHCEIGSSSAPYHPPHRVGSLCFASQTRA